MAVDLTTTETEEFGGRVYQGYQFTDLFGMTGMQFYGARPTEVVNVPVVQKGDAKFLDDGGDHTDDDSSMKGVGVPLFTPLKSMNTVKRSQVDTRPNLGLLRNLGLMHGQNVGELKTITCLNVLAGAADGAGNNINGDFTGSGVPAAAKDSIKELAGTMDKAGIPSYGRRCMMDSTLFYELADQDGVMSVDFGGQANRRTIGGNLAVIEYLNILIFNCGLGFGTDWTNTNLHSHDFDSGIAFNMSDVRAVAWHEQAWALRHQTALEAGAGWVEHKQSWLALARLHMGAKEVMTHSDQDNREGIYNLVHATGA